VRVIEGAGLGMARVTLSFDACEEVDVSATVFFIPVAAPPTKK
jgi:hypothetical protein